VPPTTSLVMLNRAALTPLATAPARAPAAETRMSFARRHGTRATSSAGPRDARYWPGRRSHRRRPTARWPRPDTSTQSSGGGGARSARRSTSRPDAAASARLEPIHAERNGAG
jgi:hypothetical protein